jgi:hypothetical protein
MDKMVPGKTRLLALEFIRQHKQTIFVCLYFRQGSRRVTRQPYRICVELLFDWAWRMASFIKPNALGQRIKPTPNEMGRFHRAPLKPQQPVNKTVELDKTTDKASLSTEDTEQNSSIKEPTAIEPSLAPSIVFELEKLVQLKDQGYISEQEFGRAKSKLLSD